LLINYEGHFMCWKKNRKLLFCWQNSVPGLAFYHVRNKVVLHCYDAANVWVTEIKTSGL